MAELVGNDEDRYCKTRKKVTKLNNITRREKAKLRACGGENRVGSECRERGGTETERERREEREE